MEYAQEESRLFSFRPDSAMMYLLQEEKKLERSSDQMKRYLSLSNRFCLAIQAGQGIEDWQEAAELVENTRKGGEIEVPTIMQVRLSEAEAGDLEKLFERIRMSLGLVRPRLNYLFKVLMAGYVLQLRSREAAKKKNQDPGAEELTTAGGLVGALVELLFRDPEAEEAEEVRKTILKWRERTL